jgi:hypothetical protein
MAKGPYGQRALWPKGLMAKGPYGQKPKANRPNDKTHRYIQRARCPGSDTCTLNINARIYQRLFVNKFGSEILVKPLNPSVKRPGATIQSMSGISTQATINLTPRVAR